jgi:type VI secretion system secreted protein Hcp
MAESDIFLVIEGIPGEEKEPKDAIKIEEWKWTEYGGGKQGKVDMNDFTFAAKVNKASPKILEYCAKGETIKSATLTCREAGGTPQTYLSIKLINCTVSYFQTGVEPNQSSSVALDRFHLKFQKIEYDYKAKGDDGKRGGSIKANFDLAQNKVY